MRSGRPLYKTDAVQNRCNAHPRPHHPTDDANSERTARIGSDVDAEPRADAVADQAQGVTGGGRDPEDLVEGLAHPAAP